MVRFRLELEAELELKHSRGIDCGKTGTCSAERCERSRGVAVGAVTCEDVGVVQNIEAFDTCERCRAISTPFGNGSSSPACLC